MSKILVITNCAKCPGFIEGVCRGRTPQGFACIFEGVEPDLNKIPDNCPLPNLPEEATPENSDMGINWNLGWNAALAVIKTITGGEEE